MRVPANVILVVIAALASLGHADAAGERALLCTFESRVYLDPGASFTPARGGYEGSGTATCRGSFDGADVDGVGTISYEGIGGYSGPVADSVGGDTCVAGSGTGTVSISIQSTEGTPIELLAAYELVRIGATGIATGEQLAATFQFLPAPGTFDCVYSPIEQAAVTGQILVSDAA